MDAKRLLANLVAAWLMCSSMGWAQYQSPSSTEVARTIRPAEVPTRITNNPDFGIPFELASAQSNVVEVQLHISTDRGARWQVYQKQQPTATGFQFRATGDGEYWFAVRTIDRGQESRRIDPSTLQPELKVVVDTKLPTLDIRVNVNNAGQATVQWLAEDPNLVASSFRLKYQNDTTGWQDVVVKNPDERDLRTQWQGQTQWSLRTQSNEVVVRAEVVDRGGNVKQVDKRVSLAAVSRNVQTNKARSPVGQSWVDMKNGIGKPLASLFGGVQHADRSFGASASNWAGGWADKEPVEDFRSASSRGNADRNQRNNATPNSSSFDRNFNNGVTGSNDQFSNANTNPNRNRRQRNEFDGAGRTLPTSTSRSEFGQQANLRSRSEFERPRSEFGQQADARNRSEFNQPRSEFGRQPADFGRQRDNFPSQEANNRQPRSEFAQERNRSEFSQSTGSFTPSQGNHSFANSRPDLRRSDSRFVEPRQQPARGNVSGPVAQRRPYGQGSTGDREDTFQPRITASPNFELVYDLYGVRGRPRQVELWFTRDRSRTWELYGSDNDQQSPMQVQLEKQGLYGFQLIVDGGRGNVPQPPQNGDDADVWVVVDWTKPVGTITRVELPTGALNQEVRIEWTAQDTLLSDTPITLSVAESPDGPWTPIASGIPNSGAYQWRVDSRLPQRFFVQLEVRDMAGNVASHIRDSNNESSARITDVRPVSR